MRQGWIIIVWATIKFVLPLLLVYIAAFALVSLLLPLVPEIRGTLAAILTVWAIVAWKR